jgi:hypothetical protein
MNKMRAYFATIGLVLLAWGVAYSAGANGDRDASAGEAKKSAPSDGHSGNSSPLASVADVGQAKAVRSKDLLRTVKITGELGHPWGTIVTIRGVVRSSDDGKRIQVSLYVGYVNGKKLSPPAEIGVMQIQPFSRDNEVELKEDREYELRGYEFGKIMDVPREAVDEAIKSHDPMLSYDYVKFGWKFVPHFNYVYGKEISAKAEKKEDAASR